MGDIYGKPVYDELVKNSELYKVLLEENKKLKDKIKDLTKYKRKYFQFYNIDNAVDENIKLKEENELLRQCLDKMMFEADVLNITIHGELGDYVYVRSDKQLKLNVEE